MKKNLVAFFKLPWYFVLFSIYPVLYLLLENLYEVQLVAGLRSIVVSSVSSLLLFLFFLLIYRSRWRAAFVVLALLLLFFSYGHVYNLLQEQFEIPRLGLWLGGVWIVLTALALLWAARKKYHFKAAVPFLNVISIGLVLFVVAQIVWFTMPSVTDTPADEYAPIQKLVVPEEQAPPDIYYIIIDSYARTDVLMRAFDYDNSTFIHRLEEIGFYVADCAQSNYNRTDVSLGSSMNMDYLQNLSEDYQTGKTGRRRLWASINNSAVRLMLEEAGYKTVAFSTGFSWTELDGVDVFLTPYTLYSPMNEFETLLLRTTPARHLEDFGLINLDEIDGQRFRERTLFIFDSMDDLAHMLGPKFVFIHVIPPHPPFVFSPDGSWTDPALFLNQDHNYTAASYTEGYQNQVEYITAKIQTAVETLLAESSRPPIIILQGDHSAWLQTSFRKFTILNAYYLPGHTDLLYRDISPVNTFRLIFSTYFGADYELLPDISYYSPVPNIYEFEKISNPCRIH